MKTDKTTKFLLVIIAIALWTMILKDLTPTATAEQITKVDITAIAGRRIYSEGLPVTIK